MADTERRHLEGTGEYDYDYVNDILFFKIADRTYDRSIELDRFVIDIDSEDFIVGIQVFDASRFLRIPKESLRDIRRWRFESLMDKNHLEVRFVFETIVRNKVVQKEPIIIETVKEDLPDSQVICTVP